MYELSAKMPNYIFKSLLERIDSLESKLHHIENRQGCLYGSIKGRNLFEYIHCLLNLSKKIKKDLLYKQKCFKSKHKQMITQMYDKVSVLESEILGLVEPQMTLNSNSTMGYPGTKYSTECRKCNKLQNCYNSTMLWRYYCSFDGRKDLLNSTKCMPGRYFEKLPFESKNVCVEESSSDLSENLLFSDTSSTSETGIIIDEEEYYIESTADSIKETKRKSKYKRNAQPFVPVNVYSSKPKTPMKKIAPAKSKQNFKVESSNVPRIKKQGKKHNTKRKKEHNQFRLEKSDSRRAVNPGQHQMQNNKTEVFFVNKNSTSPWHDQKSSVDFTNAFIYKPSSKDGVGKKLSSNSRHGVGEFVFDMPADQALYYVDVNPANSKGNKTKNQGFLFDAKDKHSKTSIESQFIKSKWKHSIQNGAVQNGKTVGRDQFENYANDDQTLRLKHKLNKSEIVSVVFPEYKLNSSEPKQKPILSKSFDGQIKTTNAFYSVIKAHSNGDILLRKLRPRDDALLHNEESQNNRIGFKELRGGNKERKSFGNLFGTNPNVQPVFVMNVPLHGQLPTNGNIQNDFNIISEPNITPDSDGKSVFESKQSLPAIDAFEPNNEAQTEIKHVPRGLQSLSKHPSKENTYANMEKRSSEKIVSKISLTSFNERKNSFPSKINKFEKKSISETPVVKEQSFSNNKESSQRSLNMTFRPKKKRKFGKNDNLKADSDGINTYDTNGSTKNESKEVEIVNKRSTVITPLKESEMINEKYANNHIKTSSNTKIVKEHHGASNQNYNKLNYSLHFEKERHAYLDMNSIPSTFSIANIIPSKCNKVKSQKEIIISEHKLNGKEYHSKVHEFFANAACFKNKKILKPKRKCLNRPVSQDNCKCMNYKNINFSDCHKQSTNYDPTTDSYSLLDWKLIAHKVKERK